MFEASVYSDAETCVCVSAYVGYSTVHSQAQQATIVFPVQEHAPPVTKPCTNKLLLTL